MAIYALGDRVPKIHPSAFIHPDCTIIGSVEIGEDSSVWPSAVIRGDGLTITIGDRTSIQDGAVLHTTDYVPTTVGNDCVIGHLVHLEGCTIEDGSLVGNASVVLHRVVVHSGAIVAANAVALNDLVVPSRRGSRRAIHQDQCRQLCGAGSAVQARYAPHRLTGSIASGVELPPPVDLCLSAYRGGAGVIGRGP
jgi:carbonic anhydrase/acetyltransferase-like protein (isoleucine patch superfamily)